MPSGELGVCTHTRKDAANPAVVSECKSLHEQGCIVNRACHFNFDEAPNYTVGRCTHLPSERGNMNAVAKCKRLNEHYCLT